MLDFSGGDEKAKLIALHYAEQMGDKFIVEFIDKDLGIKNAGQAVTLSQFYWRMLACSAEDKENKKIILEENDMQYWMERLMNIIGGYLDKMGYSAEWNQVCDEV